MPQTMRAAIARELRRPLKIETLPVPKPGRGEVLIKVKACGVCHSDLHAVEGDWQPLPNLPLIPGHEVTGSVVACGEGVGHLQVGALLGVPWLYSSCGTCEFCLAGMETICKSAEATGYSKPGGYADYMIADAGFAVKLPDGVDPYAVAPILCAGVTTYRGLKRCGAAPGQWVAIVGIGGLGHIAVQYARAMGFRVVAVDVADDKLALARELGAEVLVNGKAGDPAAAVQSLVGGAHAAVVTAVATQAFEQAVMMLRPNGTVTYIGLPGGKADEIRLSISSIVSGELSIRGSNVGTRLDLAEAVDLAARGLVTSHNRVVELEAINGVFDEMRAGKITGRVVLRLS